MRMLAVLLACGLAPGCQKVADGASMGPGRTDYLKAYTEMHTPKGVPAPHSELEGVEGEVARLQARLSMEEENVRRLQDRVQALELKAVIRGEP